MAEPPLKKHYTEQFIMTCRLSNHFKNTSVLLFMT